MSLLHQINQIPRKPGFLRLPSRGAEQYITVHYSGVSYNLQTKQQEYATLLAEAKYQINKSWGTGKNGAPVYGDGLMYDYVVLRDGEVVQTREYQQKLWHSANKLGNDASWSLHVMTGPGQSLTSAQKQGLFALIDRLRAQYNIPRQRVVGHCEWPIGDGEPITSNVYKVQPRQSPCPGFDVMADIIEYRGIADAPSDSIAVATAKDLPLLVQVQQTYGAVPIHTAPAASSPQATINATPVTLPAGVPVYVGHIENGWAHIMTGIGFVELAKMERVSGQTGTNIPCDPNPPQYSEYSPITPYLQPCVDPEKIVRYLAALPNQQYTEHDIRLIVGYYVSAGQVSRVDWLLALAQNLHETDHLRSWWAARPRRNPAGLRVTGEQRPQSFVVPANDPHWAFDPDKNVWRKGMSFGAWNQSVQAHTAWLLAYAHENATLTDAQKAYIVQSPAPFLLDRTVNRGVAESLIGLNGRWAVPGTTYATRIATLANRLKDLK